jgi:hypothetical protein
MGKKIACFSLIILFFLCSCINEKNKPNPISANPKEEISQDNITRIDNNDITNQYTFRYSNGVYYDMNDLTYFLADTSIKSLDLYSGTYYDLSPLAELRDLEELSIEANGYITDISPIGSLVNLKRLTLFNLHNMITIGNINALSSLVNLKYLKLLYKDSYYKELLPMIRLEVLKLENYFPQELNVTYIAQLRSLKELEINLGSPDLINIDELRNLVNLERLTIDSPINIDLSWLPHLQKLTGLELRRCTVNDISPLLELPNLVEVTMDYTEVRDITPLLESKSIKIISGPIVENDDGFYDLFWERGIEYYPHISDR